MPGTILLALFMALPSAAQDRLDQWPHWRGPNGDGVAPHADPPVEWSETKNVKWKVEIPGSGSATPVVWGDKIFVLTAIDTKKEAKGAPRTEDKEGMSKGAPGTLFKFDVLCLDRVTGKTLWQKTAIEEAPHDGRHPTNTYASASPMTDGKILIASFGSRGIYAYDLDGKLLWKRDLGDMKIKVNFGEGASPVLSGDSVVVNWDHEAGSFITCLDAKTGEPRWKQERDEGTTWTSPVVVGTQVVVNGTKRTRSYELATGKLLWECGGQTMNTIPLPVVREGIVYCMSGYKGYSVMAIRLDSKGDVSDSKQVVWKRNDAAPYVASPLLYEGLLYYGKERNAILTCVDAATGDLKFGPERLPEMNELYASPVGAAGRVYFSGRSGATVVLKAGPKFEVLAVNKLGETIDASPVPVGKQLLIRGEKHLYSLQKE
jgi:outer membrane protein assembly factor BamB